MTAAIFALVGTLIGVIGTLLTELVRNRVEDSRTRRENLRSACVDFTTAVARMTNLILALEEAPEDSKLGPILDAHVEARACYERLRLTAASPDIQKAGHCVVRYAFGMLRQAQGRPPRDDERNHNPRMLLQDWLMVLYSEVRREIGVPRPGDLHREPDEWLAPVNFRTAKRINEAD